MSEEPMADAGVALFEAARVYSKAKAEEGKAKDLRVAAEEKLVELTGFKLPSGSKLFTASCEAGAAKITLKQPVSYTVIESEVAELKRALTRAEFNKVFKMKHALVAKGLVALGEDDKDKFLLVKAAVVSKPGKIGVELKNLEVY